MFIDYVTLMLVNMVAGLVLLGFFYLKGIAASDGRPWAAGFAATGVIALACGLRMSWTWPLPGSYNVAFGEMAALFGVSYLGLAGALLWRRTEDEPVALRLLPVGIYTLFAGLAAVLIGIRFIHLGLSLAPVLSGIGFILAGMGGVLLPVVAHWWRVKGLRILAALVVLAAAAIWALTGYGAYWDHLGRFTGYSPTPVGQTPAE
jgi:putative membrane protein